VGARQQERRIRNHHRQLADEPRRRVRCGHQNERLRSNRQRCERARAGVFVDQHLGVIIRSSIAAGFCRTSTAKGQSCRRRCAPRKCTSCILITALPYSTRSTWWRMRTAPRSPRFRSPGFWRGRASLPPLPAPPHCPRAQLLDHTRGDTSAGCADTDPARYERITKPMDSWAAPRRSPRCQVSANGLLKARCRSLKEFG
jgi:hypothetical protein